MTDKEFRRLTREELVDIIYELQKTQEQLRAENEELKKQLADKELKMENAGSIAEAALALNGVFEAAQEAADQYLAQVRAANERTQSVCDRVIANAQRRAAEIVKQAQDEAARTAEEALCAPAQR